jgi:flagellar basal-body rod modification protein FlgD
MDSLPFDPIQQYSTEARTAAEAAAVSSASDELGRDEFLRLLITKMENQDPLSPAEDTEFISQLATFSSLEQLITANGNLEGLALGQSNLINAQALNLIGKEALIESGNEVRVLNGVADTLVYAVPTEVQTAVVTIFDEAGEPVRTIEVDTSRGSRGTVPWDGTDLDGSPVPDGTYTVSITAMDASGEPASAALFRSLPIDGVNFLDGGITLVSGNYEIPFDSIMEIRAGW